MIRAAVFALTITSTAAFAQTTDAVRIGTVSFTYVARNSKTANAALAQVQDFERKHTIAIQSRHLRHPGT